MKENVKGRIKQSMHNLTDDDTCYDPTFNDLE